MELSPLLILLIVSCGCEVATESRRNTSTSILPEDPCQLLLENFSYYTANFTYCAINHARPIGLCEACVDTFISVLTSHDLIMKEEDETGYVCKTKLINMDRLEVIEDTFQFVKSLWAKGNCDCCFEKKNGTITSQLSTNTIKFQEVWKKTDKCFNDYYDKVNKSYDSAVCTNCTDVYCEMNKFYDSLIDMYGDGNLCVDIVDAMNTTRSSWSEDLGCLKNEMTIEIQLVVAFALVMGTPFVFYLATKMFSNKNETRLLRQKRFAGRFNFPSTSGSSRRKSRD